MQLRTSDLNSLGISTVTRSWALQLNGKEMLYLFDSNNYSLYLSTDGGNSYQLVYNLGAGNQLLSMVSYQGYIYVSTSYNNVLYSIDGTSFALHSFLNGIVLNGFAIDRNKKLFAFSAAYIYFSLDGINWQQTMHYLTNALDLAVDSKGKLYIVNVSGIYISDDGGFNFTLFSNITNLEQIKIVEWK
jgi:hypothetical protein